MRLRLEFVAAAMLLLGGLVGAANAGPLTDDSGASGDDGGGGGTAVSGPRGVRNGQRAWRAPPATSWGSHSRPNYEYDTNKLPFGTRPWRDQMRRENRLGNPG
jgi:hypothetical protein